MFSHGAEIAEECRLDYCQGNEIIFKAHSAGCQSCRALPKDDKAGSAERLDLVARRKEGTIISVAPGRLCT